MNMEGLGKIVATLERLRAEGADKAALAAARAAAKEFELGIKSAIPGQYRSARKSIGRRVRKRRGEVVAKVGAGVGKRSAARGDRGKRGGVGLSKANIHWAILGVQDRQTAAGANRGRHDGFLRGVVTQGASQAELRAAVAMRDAVKRVLDSEATG